MSFFSGNLITGSFYTKKQIDAIISNTLLKSNASTLTTLLDYYTKSIIDADFYDKYYLDGKFSLYSTSSQIVDVLNNFPTFSELSVQLDNYVTSDVFTTSIALYLPTSSLGASVCELDNNGKIPLPRMPAQSMIWQSMWNPSTNTPTLYENGAERTHADYYMCSAAGTWNGMTFQTGDWIIWNEFQQIWQKSQANEDVVSVFGRIGAVTATVDDYSAFYQPIGSYLTTSSAMANYQPIGSYPTIISMNGAITTALSSYSNTIAMNSAITTALSSFSNTTAMNSAITTATSSALSSYSNTIAMNSAITTALSSFSNTTAMNGAITAATSSFITSSALSSYSNTIAMNSAITTALSSFSNTTAMNSAITTALSSFSNTTSMNSAITGALSSYSNTTAMNSAITTALSSFSNTIAMNSAITTALSSYSNTTAMNSAITTATSSFITSSALSSYSNTIAMNSAITTALSLYSNTTAMNSAITAATSSFITSSALSSYQTISGMSSYLTNATAGSTYLTQTNAGILYQPLMPMSYITSLNLVRLQSSIPLCSISSVVGDYIPSVLMNSNTGVNCRAIRYFGVGGTPTYAGSIPNGQTLSDFFKCVSSTSVQYSSLISNGTNQVQMMEWDYDGTTRKYYSNCEQNYFTGTSNLTGLLTANGGISTTSLTASANSTITGTLTINSSAEPVGGGLKVVNGALVSDIADSSTFQTNLFLNNRQQTNGNAVSRIMAFQTTGPVLGVPNNWVGVGTPSLLEFIQLNSAGANNISFNTALINGSLISTYQTINLTGTTTSATYNFSSMSWSGTATFNNALTVSGGISTTTLTASGLLTASSGISTTTLTTSGALTVTGNLSANGGVFSNVTSYIGGVNFYNNTYVNLSTWGTQSEICNDTTSFKALMVLGNTSAGGVKKINLYDDVSISGNLTLPNGSITLTTGNLTISGASGMFETPFASVNQLLCASLSVSGTSYMTGDVTMASALNVSNNISAGMIQSSYGVMDGVSMNAMRYYGMKNIVAGLRFVLYGYSSASTNSPPTSSQMFDKLLFESTANTVGTVSNIALVYAGGTYQNWEALGYVLIDTENYYYFSASSDDGCEIFIDGYLVCSHYGVMGVYSTTVPDPSCTLNKIYLKVGLHRFYFRVNNIAGGNGAYVFYKQNAGSYTIIPTTKFYRHSILDA